MSVVLPKKRQNYLSENWGYAMLPIKCTIPKPPCFTRKYQQQWRLMRYV